MKRLVKGVEVLFNLAYMVRGCETNQARLQNAAEKAFPALEHMVDYLAEQKEAKYVDATPDVYVGEGCCNHLYCCKSGRGNTP